MSPTMKMFKFYLLQDLGERLVVGGDDGSVVVLEVLVDHGPAPPHGQARHPLPGHGAGGLGLSLRVEGLDRRHVCINDLYFC